MSPVLPPMLHVTNSTGLGDYFSMNDFLFNTDWNPILCFNPSAQSSWIAFVQKIHSVIDMFVPTYRVPRSSNVVRHSKPACPKEVKMF